LNSSIVKYILFLSEEVVYNEQAGMMRAERNQEGGVRLVPLPVEISIGEAERLIKGDYGVLLIDARSDGAFSLGHIDGAHSVPLDRLEEKLPGFTTDKERPILVYCAVGVRSVDTVEMLRSGGYENACSLAGGYSAWRAAGQATVSESKLSVHQRERYSRNILLGEIGEEGQVRLMNAKVLLVGAGGLASSAGLYLATCGVGTIGIVDFDRVDLSNLNRQVFHGTEDVGRLKVESAKSAMERINPDVNVIPFAERLVPENALLIIDRFDIVMDASDNVDTKYLLNDACYFAGKPYIFGGAVGFDGQAGVFWPREKGPCLRCLFPELPPRHLTPTCSEAGVLGVVPGQIGLIQATEVIKVILGIGTPMIGKFYLYNALSLTSRILETGKNPECPLCGDNPRIRALAGEGSVGYESDRCAGR
jgi:molybdopterin/thiamine biosynthesis adenylyltransferase/rhodanese-related sulfurtransferase